VTIDTRDIDIRPYDSSDETACAELIHLCYGEQAVEEKRWRHSHFGLEGSANGMMVANCADRIVGMQPMECYRFMLGGETFLGAVLTGAMVHPDFRRRGIFNLLLAECERFAWDLKADFVTTMPNEFSRPGFLKRGYFDPGERTLLVLPLSPELIARRIVRPAGLGRVLGPVAEIAFGQKKLDGASDSNSLEVDTFGTDVEKMTSRFAREWPGLIQMRSQSWLAWRFDDSFDRAYRRFVAVSDSGDVSAMAVATNEKREGQEVGYLVDLVGIDEQSMVEVAGFAVRALRDTGMDLAIAVVSCQKLITVLRSIGFWRVPHPLAPKRFYTVFLPRPGRQAAVDCLGTIENWYQTLADWDSI
jgi:GNAT superfamily N-acetyltransferase